MLSGTQLSVLRYHANAGDRIAYYTALADFGVEYGSLALGVVLNTQISGSAANTFFLGEAGEEGVSIGSNTLATISLALMQADFARRDFLSGADLTVDDIQSYHREVFDNVAGVSADAWTPNMYLDSFETLAERQTVWEQMLNSSAPATYLAIADRRVEVTFEYLASNSNLGVTIVDLNSMNRQQMLDSGVTGDFADWFLAYSQYLIDLQSAGVGSATPNGPYEIGISQRGHMIGGSGGDNTLLGTAADDMMMGMGGDDTFIGGDGADRFYGAAGDDTIDYSFALSGIVVELGTLQGGTADEWAPINTDSVVTRISDGQGNWDFAIDVEEIAGTVHDDRIQFFGDADDYFNADDVDTLLQGGGNTDLGDLLDFSAMTDVQEGLTAIWDAFGTLNFNMGSWAAAGVAQGFEAIIGSSGNDSISGCDGADRINGHLGADILQGFGADDFIFFDAADTVVDGGAGRDVAVALGEDGVTVDMAAQGLEIVIGGAGADDITVTGATGSLFAAGGAGADTFRLTFGEEEGPRVLWGGAGADTFVFDAGMSGGIAVVSIADLTEEMFATLTLADLALGNLNLGLFRAIIVNPDVHDRLMVLGQEFSEADAVGGQFVGASLSDNGELTAPAPDDPGTTPFDWRLAA